MTAAIPNIESSAPPSSDASIATPKLDPNNPLPAKDFHSVLSKKENTSTNPDEKQPVKTSTDATPVCTKKTSAEADEKPNENKNDEAATTNLALSYLLATLPG